MSNYLKHESSPYLLQHSENPVDWYPWCEEAFERARREDKPIFLSVGYSTCHWCHVMAHESFENEKIAEILNKEFISVKVDREERPDIDSVYMAFCQAFTGSGGWPMSVFMTGEKKPFFAGTYFPPESHYGRIGFRELLMLVTDKWKSDRGTLLETAEEVVGSIKEEENGGENVINPGLPELAADNFAKNFDSENGGFGLAPKFPTPHNLIFLTLYSRLYSDDTAMAQVKVTLQKMRRGGIFDQIGYGFSRYSTDPYFLVPHFEKMLYDNALLILAYAVGYKATGDKEFLDTAEKTAAYIFREMTGPEGEFYSAQDADSEGEEGKFYVWDYEEILNVLGEERGQAFCGHFGITRQGNFEGKNIPNLLDRDKISGQFQEETERLYYYRKFRERLHLDDKILTSWNGLMICGMSVLYRVTGNRQYLEAARKAQEFIENHLVKENTLYVSCREGVSQVKGFLDEYAYYAVSLLFLYDVTAQERYLERARQMCEEAVRQFGDEMHGGFYLYGTKNEDLITKPKETYDGALPAGNSVMAYCLVHLAQLTGANKDRQRAEKQLGFLSGEAARYPAGHSLFLTALLRFLNPPEKITVVLAGEDDADRIWRALPLYADVKILSEETREYALLNGKTTYYICKDYTCLPPTNVCP